MQGVEKGRHCVRNLKDTVLSVIGLFLYVPRIKVSQIRQEIPTTNSKCICLKTLQNCLTLDNGACTGTKSDEDDQQIQYNRRHVSIYILIDRAGDLVCLSKISWKNMFIHSWPSFFDQDSMSLLKDSRIFNRYKKGEGENDDLHIYMIKRQIF